MKRMYNKFEKMLQGKQSYTVCWLPQISRGAQHVDLLEGSILELANM